MSQSSKLRIGGWLLFDDEMVEPVDKSFVRNFFGDRPGLACAYVLFYQETTLEAMKKEQAAEGPSDVDVPQVIESAKEVTGLGLKTNGIQTNGSQPLRTPASPINEVFERANGVADTLPVNQVPQDPLDTSVTPTAMSPSISPLNSSKGDLQPKKERKAAEKEQEKSDKGKRKTFEFRRKDNDKTHDLDTKSSAEGNKDLTNESEPKAGLEDGLKVQSVAANGISGGLSRFRQTSKSISKRPKFWSSKESSKEEPALLDGETNPSSSSQSVENADKTEKTDRTEKLKNRLINLRKKKSNILL